MKINNLAIIQARSNSTRLPKKVLMKLQDKTVLEHVINRVKESHLIDDIVVATTLNNDDIEIVKICSKNNIKVYCGSEDDVLDRFYQIAKILKPTNVIRITADCPVIDPKIIDMVIESHLSNSIDYTSNTIVPTFPDGLDIEVFKFYALEKAFFNATLLSEREHVTPYIRNNKDIFTDLNVKNKINYSNKRWTLDNKEDFEFLSIIYENLYHKNNLFGFSEILDFLEKNPEIEKINSSIERNEGYKKSLLND